VSRIGVKGRLERGVGVGLVVGQGVEIYSWSKSTLGVGQGVEIYR